MGTYLKSAMLLLLVVLASSISHAALSDTDIVSGINLRAYLLNQEPDPAEPGKYVEVRFRLLNYGHDPLEDLVVELEADGPFTIDSSTPARVDLGALSGRQLDEYGALLSWKLRVDKDAVEGEHELILHVRHGEKTVYKKDGFMVDVRTQNPVLAVRDVMVSPQETASGSSAQIQVSVENTADTYLKDIVLLLDTRAVPFAPIGTTGEKTIKTLDAHETRTVTFPLYVNAQAESGVHKVPLLIGYLDASGNRYAKNASLGVRVSNPPKYLLNVEETDLHQAGKMGKVVVSLSNVGVDDLRFVRLKLLDSESFEVLSSSLSYLGNLESDDFQTAEFQLYAHPDLSEVPLRLEVSFTDSFNEDHSTVHDLTLPLYDAQQALLYGVATKDSKMVVLIILSMIGFILTVFWLSMVADVLLSGLPQGKKLLWGSIVVVTFVIGAVLYYLIGRKKGA